MAKYIFSLVLMGVFCLVEVVAVFCSAYFVISATAGAVSKENIEPDIPWMIVSLVMLLVSDAFVKITNDVRPRIHEVI